MDIIIKRLITLPKGKKAQEISIYPDVEFKNNQIKIILKVH